MCDKQPSRRRNPTVLFTVIAVGLVLGGCDLSVTNPGPTPDEALDNPGAHESMIAGMNRVFADALDDIASTTAFVSKELTFDGTTGLWTTGVDARERGWLTEEGTNSEWSAAQQARWVAEDGVQRLRRILEGNFSSSGTAARALLHAGYSNRLLGENMCEAVINGGAPEPYTVFLDRAEDQFSEAIEVAGQAGDGSSLLAAYAGRASIRMWQGDWSGAASDAEQVPADFVYEQPYDFVDSEQVNGLAYTVGDSISALLSHTVYGTFYADYYEETGDPRTPWTYDPDVPTGDAGDFPLYRQRKYLSVTAPIRVSSGAEARLIRAEAKLRGGDWEGAVELINERRAALGVPEWQVSDEVEAWTALKRERGIELWLEGRRVADLRRWTDEGIPGEMEDMDGRDLCFPIPDNERDRNPNIP